MSQELAVRPMTVASLSLTPGTVVGGAAVQGAVKLECKAGPRLQAAVNGASKSKTLTVTP